MTLLQKIQNLTWFNEVNKLKDILSSFLTLMNSLTDRVEVIEETPAYTPPYKIYRALLTQSGTNAPTAIVLENTLGITPVFSRVGVGEYRISAIGKFTNNKTFLKNDYNSIEGLLLTTERIDTDVIRILSEAEPTYISSTYTPPVPEDDLFNKTPLEIIVYN